MLLVLQKAADSPLVLTIFALHVAAIFDNCVQAGKHVFYLFIYRGVFRTILMHTRVLEHNKYALSY